ncbi:MAG: hypothetical protein AAFN10_02005 [Bacteroidota bacterium]
MRSDQAWIEDYLAGALTAAEQRSLEERMAEDEGLREAFREAAHIYAATKIDARRHLKEELTASLRSQKPEANKAQRRLVMRPWVWAAAAVMVLGLSYFLLRPSRTTPQSLYASYYEAPATLSMRQDSKMEAWESAMTAYTQGDFAQAQRQLLTLADDSSFSRPSALALYLGITYLESQEPDRALDYFQQIGDHSLYSPHRTWYSALAHLQAERPAKAKTLLQKISSTAGHFKQTEAQLLLAEEALTKF